MPYVRKIIPGTKERDRIVIARPKTAAACTERKSANECSMRQEIKSKPRARFAIAAATRSGGEIFSSPADGGGRLCKSPEFHSRIISQHK